MNKVPPVVDLNFLQRSFERHQKKFPSQKHRFIFIFYSRYLMVLPTEIHQYSEVSQIEHKF